MTYYTKNDEWIRVEGQEAWIGITSQGAEHLGDVTYVDLPALGKNVDKDGVICAIESVKAAVDLYAPASGTVTLVNDALVNKPELLNESPEDQGWIVKLELKDPAELQGLLDRDAYLQSKE